MPKKVSRAGLWHSRKAQGKKPVKRSVRKTMPKTDAVNKRAYVLKRRAKSGYS